MPTRDEMMSAIKANPAEDLPRLLYADWLDEQDDRTDHDKATAEFIRLSCRMDNKKVSSVRQGNWLDGWPDGYHDGTKGHVSPPTTGFSRLIPAFQTWVDSICMDPYRMQDFMPPNVRYVAVVRNGRVITARWRKTMINMPELIHLEFWRGFLRKAEFRHWGEAELLIPKLIGDQPLMEPEMRNFLGATREEYGNRRGRFVAYSETLGPKATAAILELPAKWRPDEVYQLPPMYEHITRFTWVADTLDGPGVARAKYRAMWAQRLALRAAYATPSQEPSGQSELASDGAFRPWPGGQVPPWPEPVR